MEIPFWGGEEACEKGNDYHPFGYKSGLSLKICHLKGRTRHGYGEKHHFTKKDFKPLPFCGRSGGESRASETCLCMPQTAYSGKCSGSARSMRLSFFRIDFYSQAMWRRQHRRGVSNRSHRAKGKNFQTDSLWHWRDAAVDDLGKTTVHKMGLQKGE